MADYIVKDTELTSVANAIRTAGGTNSLLNFPNGFVSAVNNISSGGSSDFSTAQVTIVNNTAESFDILLLPTYDVEEGTGFTVCALGNQLDSGASVTIPVVLYKGKCIWVTYAVDVYTDYTFIGSGNVSIMDSGMPIITGDCTITIDTDTQ